MAFKFVTILALVGVVAAGVVPVPQVYHQYAAPTAAHATYAVKAAPALVAHAPVAVGYAHPAPAVAYSHAPTVVKSLAYAPHPHSVLAKHEEEYFDAHPQYKYNYNVQDDITGDSKSQVEERDGDVVTGEYSLIDADGFRRVVQYTADSLHGFNAVVNRIPLEHVKTVVKTIAPVATYAHAPAIAAPIAVAPYHEHHH